MRDSPKGRAVSVVVPHGTGFCKRDNERGTIFRTKHKTHVQFVLFFFFTLQQHNYSLVQRQTTKLIVRNVFTDLLLCNLSVFQKVGKVRRSIT